MAKREGKKTEAKSLREKCKIKNQVTQQNKFRATSCPLPYPKCIHFK